MKTYTLTFQSGRIYTYERTSMLALSNGCHRPVCELSPGVWIRDRGVLIWMDCGR